MTFPSIFNRWLKVGQETHQALTKYKTKVARMPRNEGARELNLELLESNYLHFHFSPYTLQSSLNNSIHTQSNLQFLSDQVNFLERASTDGIRVPFGLVLVF